MFNVLINIYTHLNFICYYNILFIINNLKLVTSNTSIKTSFEFSILNLSRTNHYIFFQSFNYV